MRLLGLLLVLAIILSIRFSVEFRLVTEGLNIHPRLRFGVGRVLFTMPQGMIKRLNQAFRKKSLGSFESAVRGFKAGFRLLDNFLQTIELLHLEVQIGTGDPFSTALGTGGIWALISPVLSGLNADNRLRTLPEIRIEPDYDEVNLQVDLHCIFQFRLGQIIINEVKKVMV